MAIGLNHEPGEEESRVAPEYSPVYGKVIGFLSIFIPQKGYIVTPLIIDLNLIVFGLMVLSGVNALLPESENLLAWGANFRGVTLEGEWWRLITNCFLHIGIFHLIMNMYALYFIGLLLEPYLGTGRFAAAYLLTGIMASLASLWWNNFTVSAGASGAIFGLYGVFLSMLTADLVDKSDRKSLFTSIAVFVGYNILYGMRGGIDNAAHIGGVLCGVFIGFSYFPGLRKHKTPGLKYLTIALLTLVTISVSAVVYRHLPNDMGKYNAFMKEFTALEEKALEIYNMPKDAPKEQLLASITENGLPGWKESIRIIGEADKLDLPDDLYDRNKKILWYCDLRIKSYELIYKSINEETEQYTRAIGFYDRQIEAVIAELNGR
jgi:rhomboid protease GluP